VISYLGERRVKGGMKMSNLQKWFLIVAMWIVILALIFAFYWVKIRPVKIRQICEKDAGKISTEITSGLANQLEVHQAVYSHCLRRYGIEK
jgi:hypothetical protein